MFGKVKRGLASFALASTVAVSGLLVSTASYAAINAADLTAITTEVTTDVATVTAWAFGLLAGIDKYRAEITGIGIRPRRSVLDISDKVRSLNGAETASCIRP